MRGRLLIVALSLAAVAAPSAGQTELCSAVAFSGTKQYVRWVNQSVASATTVTMIDAPRTTERIYVVAAAISGSAATVSSLSFAGSPVLPWSSAVPGDISREFTTFFPCGPRGAGLTLTQSSGSATVRATVGYFIAP